MTKLEELKAAYEASTPGEWVTGKGGTAYYPLQIRCVSSDWDSLIAAFHSWDAQKESNANFIALAHNLMPTLLEAVAFLGAVPPITRRQLEAMTKLNAAQVEAIAVADANLNNADLPLYSAIKKERDELYAALRKLSSECNGENLGTAPSNTRAFQ